jgi:glutathione S-transferase
MKLLYQTHSPYARKALVFAHEAGLASRLKVVHQETSPTLRNEHVFAENPLGKVPVLLRPAAPPIFDSDVICAYFDTLHDGHIAVATALDWLEFRELPGFRERRPRLTAWFDEFAARPSMLATPLSGETHDRAAAAAPR